MYAAVFLQMYGCSEHWGWLWKLRLVSLMLLLLTPA